MREWCAGVYGRVYLYTCVVYISLTSFLRLISAFSGPGETGTSEQMAPFTLDSPTYMLISCFGGKEMFCAVITAPGWCISLATEPVECLLDPPLWTVWLSGLRNPWDCVLCLHFAGAVSLNHLHHHFPLTWQWCKSCTNSLGFSACMPRGQISC